MKVQKKAELYRDAKGLWRVRAFDAKKNDKGMAVPLGLRSELTEAHDGTAVTVVKVNGQIDRLLFEKGDVPEVVKKGPHQILELEKFSQQTIHDDSVSPSAKGDGVVPGSAVLAYQCAEDALRLGDGYKEYKNHAKSLSMMIRTNGLGATMAFLESKKEGHFITLKDDIAKFLRQNEQGLNTGNFYSKAIKELDSNIVKELTKKVLSFVAWLSRFASGLIQGGNEQKK